MQATVERFFEEYAANFNRALGGKPDFKRIRAAFTPCFVGAGPTGVACGKNNRTFSATLRKAYAFYRSIGMQEVRPRNVSVLPIDDLHAQAKVSYDSSYQRSGVDPIEIAFEVTYLLHFTDKAPRIFAFVAGDEMAAFKAARLIPDDAAGSAPQGH